MKEAAELQYLFQTLADVNRLRIIQFLGREERPVSEIVAFLRQSQPLVSHHLRVLRESGVLTTRRDGPFVFYSLRDKRLIDALGIFQEVAAAGEGEAAAPRMFCCPPWWRWRKPGM